MLAIDPMPPSDSSIQPIIMPPIKSIWPSPRLMGAYSSTSGLKGDTQRSGEEYSNRIIQDLIMILEHMESSNLALRTKVEDLTNRVAKIEEENISLKKQLNGKEQEALHHPPSNPYRLLTFKTSKRRSGLSRPPSNKNRNTH
jgi:hypothetical protein